MVYNKTVNVETDKRDRYGRELGKVLDGGKRWVLLKLGNACSSLCSIFTTFSLVVLRLSRQADMPVWSVFPRMG